VTVTTVHISDNIRELQPSATLAVAALAKELAAQGRDIVDLSAGEPDSPTPEFIAEAGIDAIRKGHIRYTPAAGLPALKQAIARNLERRSGRSIDPAGIVVSNGAKQSLFNVCFTLFGPGDQVLLPVPYWTSYPDLIRLARAEPVEVTGDVARSARVGIQHLEAAYSPRVRGLILNSPSNPSGAVYGRDELQAILRWTAERDIWVISDEIYGRLCYVADHAPGLLDLEPAALDRAVLIDGASKSFAMTGWRIGFSYSSRALADSMGALQSHITSNPSTPAQYAALAAYSQTEAQDRAVQQLHASFQRRRDLVLELFREHLPEVEYIRPEGAFYLFFRLDSFYGGDTPDSISMCRRLLQEAGVALVPGSAFGDDRYARLSFATSEQALRAGIQRMAAALGSLVGSPS
jgi:aspartate aminotransferase